MTASALWRDANQAGLCRELDRLYATMSRFSGAAANESAAVDESSASSLGEAVTRAEAQALDRVAQVFGLSTFERDVLLLCAGVELESRFGVACAEAQKDPHLQSPTFSMALTLLPDGHWSAVGPDGPLRYWRLIEVGAGSLMRAPLRIDERILHYIAGAECHDERLEPIWQALAPEAGPACQAYTDCAERAVACWSAPAASPVPVLLAGRRNSDRRSVTHEICRLVGWHGFVMRAADVPASAQDRQQLARLCNRETLLARALLCIEALDPDAHELEKLSAFLLQIKVPYVVETQEGSAAEHLDGLRIHIPRLEVQERKAVWLETLGADPSVVNGSLDRVSECFDLDRSSIRLAAELMGPISADRDLGRTAWETCRAVSRRALEGLAQRIDAKASWEDLVLPELQTETLKQIVAHVRQRALVHGQWGFSERYSRGLGVTALFAGSSGTGKTLAAEVIARAIDLDLYQIDLAGVVSKYIGETEKNLRRIFDAAEDTGAVLLFDEADALFGKRSEVRDSHDRYANLEISYLLQRMESYRGLAILTTNMKHALDTAFLRRIRFIVQFPFPDAPGRQRIWERVFPRQAPVGAVDYARISQLNVAGGVIRNIATHAAFLAADQGSQIELSHILSAARVEYAKIDRPLTPAEIAGWA